MHAYLATVEPLPRDDLRWLAERLAEVAEQIIATDQPAARPHLARAFRLPIQADSAPMVRLDWLVFVLWSARDDAHNAAWRAKGFDGPTLDVLTRLWIGEAWTADGLITVLAASQWPADVTDGIERLIAAGYVARDDSQLRLTRRGRRVHDLIEAETDRLYFAPWPSLPDATIARMITTLRRLIEVLF